tara:strand:+ start:112 stop:432 length:321 start_codon:yes stop_codon:yes gene_type:complete
MSKIIFYEEKDKRKEIEAHPGQTLLEVAREYEIDIEGTCEGNLACATCHLIIDKDWFFKLPEATEDERDMLDLVNGLTVNSRLGCQIKVTADLDGLIVFLPPACYD